VGLLPKTTPHFSWLYSVPPTFSHLLKSLGIAIMDDTMSVKSGSPAGTTASNGTKRKRGNEVKYYAVRVGYQPGVYHTWADCLEQVKGFKRGTCEFG